MSNMPELPVARRLQNFATNSASLIFMFPVRIQFVGNIIREPRKGEKDSALTYIWIVKNLKAASDERKDRSPGICCEIEY